MSYRFIRTAIVILVLVLSLSVFSPVLTAQSSPVVQGPTAETFEESTPSGILATLEALWNQLIETVRRGHAVDPEG